MSDDLEIPPETPIERRAQMVADVICSHRVGLDRRAFTQKLLAQQFREIVKEARGED